MAEIEKVVVKGLSKPNGNAVGHQWETVTAGDTCEVLEDATMGDRSLQASGTWDGATITLEGSNDGVTYVPLNDSLGNAISLTADGIVQIGELTRFLKPVITAGTTVDLDLTLISRRA